MSTERESLTDDLTLIRESFIQIGPNLFSDEIDAVDRVISGLDALAAERDRWRAVACNVKDKYDQGWHDAVIAARGRAARDEYQRLWHEASAEVARLREALVEAREFVDRRFDGTDRSRHLLDRIDALLAAPTKEDTDMSDNADVIREWLSLDPRAPRADWEATPDDFAEAVAALDALVAERDEARRAVRTVGVMLGQAETVTEYERILVWLDAQPVARAALRDTP